MKKILPFLFCMLIALFSCEKEPPTPPTPDTPSKVETGAAENIASTSATLKGMVNVDIIDYEEIVFGVMYSTKAEDLVDFTAPSKNGLVLIGNEFKVEVTDLKAETKYYYRAYVMLNNLQILLGDVKEFTTLEKSGSEDEGGSEGEDEGGSEGEGEDPSDHEDSHEYVDLGLSVKWATCNIGADNPEEYGVYFAWGEIQPKSNYFWNTYKYCDGDKYSMNKYCVDSSYGTVDNKTTLEPSDDAANANWGGDWRMPTREEVNELLNECNWQKETINGVNGYTVEGPNGNTIFLPAAGTMYEMELLDKNAYCAYWSSSLDDQMFSYGAFTFYFYPDEVSWNYYERCSGLPIRPVLP